MSERERELLQQAARLALSPREFAVAWGVSHPTVYRWIREGLPTVKRGAVTRIIPDEAIAWLRANQSEAAE